MFSTLWNAMGMSQPISMFDQWRLSLTLNFSTIFVGYERNSEVLALRCCVVERQAWYKFHQQMVNYLICHGANVSSSMLCCRMGWPRCSMHRTRVISRWWTTSSATVQMWILTTTTLATPRLCLPHSPVRTPAYAVHGKETFQSYLSVCLFTGVISSGQVWTAPCDALSGGIFKCPCGNELGGGPHVVGGCSP